jgi:hypothetical protein
MSPAVADPAATALSADATVAVTGGDDATVRVWALDWEHEFGADDSAGAQALGWMQRGWQPPFGDVG